MHFNLSDLFGSKAKRPSSFTNSYLFSIPTMTERSKRVEQRVIESAPYKILDAPGLIDDYYLNLLDWSSNRIVIALGDACYSYNVDTKEVSEIFRASQDHAYVSSIKGHENKLAIGDSCGQIYVYDFECGRTVDKRQYHTGRVASISFNDKVMSSGDKSGKICNLDARTNNVMCFEGHTQEVCGLKWSPNSEYLASGSNDNTVRVWRLGSPISRQLKGHESAVKALDWCPWKFNVLCTGGGTKDKTIKTWDADNGKLIKSTNVSSQVCTINHLKKYKELITGHGFQDNDLKLWKYSDMRLVSSFGSHESRVLHTALSPDECTIVSLGADESVKFWKIADKPNKQFKRDSIGLR